jgi:hypothetical protein
MTAAPTRGTRAGTSSNALGAPRNCQRATGIGRRLRSQRQVGGDAGAALELELPYPPHQHWFTTQRMLALP